MDKRFIEEIFPVKEVSEESAKEKNIRHSNISTLHIWWTRKPLGSSRATNYASLIPKSKDEIDLIQKKDFIVKLSKWKNSLNFDLINTAKKNILEEFKGVSPKILDPFSGGGSIPLEALRIGCEVYANDLNPVAVLIEKCTMEYPLIYKNLEIDVKKWGNFILKEVEKEIGCFYPRIDHEKNITVGYVWARTIKCKSPTCCADIPLMVQYWLAKKKNHDVALYPQVKNNQVHFKIVGDEYGGIPQDFDPNVGTISRAVVTCPVCGFTIDPDDTASEFYSGNSDEKLIAIISINTKKSGKFYQIANESDIESYNNAENHLEVKINEFINKWEIDPIPNEELPPVGTLGFRVQRYGMLKWADLYNNRQKLSIITFMDKIRDVYKILLEREYDKNYAKAIISYFALGLDRLADFGSNVCMLNVTGGRGVVHTFGRHSIPMTWTYFESNPFNPKAAGWQMACKKNEKWIEHASQIDNKPPKIIQASATKLPYEDNYFDAIFTDPPYYDNVPYSYLSDFFYVWLKRTVGDIHPELFSTPLTPKSDEILAYAHGRSPKESKEYFEENLKISFQEIYRVVKKNGIVNIVYAHKTTDGWETVINALLDSGLTVTASWPLSTEMKGRLRAQKSAALASSIYIISRKIDKTDFGWFKDVKEEISQEIPVKLDKLWDEGISGADFFIAAIGLSIEIFGKYKKIMDNEGNEIRGNELLDFVRGVVTDYTVRNILHNGMADQLSPLTKFYLLWRWNYQEASMAFDEAKKIAQSAGIDLENEWKKGLIKKRSEMISVEGPIKRDKMLLKNSKELIDVIHYVCLLWKEGKKDEMKFVLKESGYGNNEVFYRVSQAISETLPNSSSEKKLIEGFLAGKDRIIQYVNEDNSNNSQTKLV